MAVIPPLVSVVYWQLQAGTVLMEAEGGMSSIGQKRTSGPRIGSTIDDRQFRIAVDGLRK
jgi:hypothetical protein